MQRPLILFIVLGCAIAGASSEVLKVATKTSLAAVSDDKARPWRVKDGICIQKDGKDVACGMIVRIVKGAAIAKLGDGIDQVNPGDSAIYTREIRRSSAAITIRGGANYSRFNIAFGTHASTTFFFPTLDVQFAVSRHIALGLIPFFYQAKNTDDPSAVISVSAFGAYLAFNYYTRDAFQGLWFQTGPAYHIMSGSQGSTEEKKNVLGFKGTIGYRFHIGSTINIGVAAGGAYKVDPNFSFATDNSANFQPLATADLAISF